MSDAPQPGARPPQRTDARYSQKRAPARGGRMPGRRRTRLNRQPPVHIGTLLQHREFIKVSAFLLPKAMKAGVLELMERLRQQRMDRQLRPRTGQPVLPEMTDGELLREIKWRIGTLPPGDAEAVARYIRHITQWYSERRKKAARMWHLHDAASPGPR